MGKSGGKKGGKGKKVRVAFRRNRSKPPRPKDWTQQARQADENEVDSHESEGVAAKGDLSRHRTIIVPNDQETTDLHRGIVIAMRGLYAEVDDGERIWRCTVRRVLRTRLTNERHPVTVGDKVRFSIESTADEGVREGAIESVDPRTGQLRRRARKRIHTIVANVDQAIVVTSAREPTPKPNLIDRYIVAAHAGGITPVICMNKVDLDVGGKATEVLQRYAALGYTTLAASASTGEGIEEFREAIKDVSSVIAGQSGVGKSSLLNAVQPGLKLRTGDVHQQTEKGKHTTTTARLIRLACGGYVIDTPGIRSFDLTVIPREEFEAHFVEFVDIVADCKYPDCTHIHEDECALMAAVENGEVHPERYRSYLQMYEDPGTVE